MSVDIPTSLVRIARTVEPAAARDNRPLYKSRFFTIEPLLTPPEHSGGDDREDTIRVLIADDHALVVEALRFMLVRESDIAVVGCAFDGRAAVERALEHTPDIVLLDYLMPVLNGIEAAEQIRERVPGAAVVMLSSSSDPNHIVRAMRAGVAGYVPKSGKRLDILRAIREVAAGRRYLHPAVSDQVLAILMRGEPALDAAELLSPRERQVLRLIAEGHTTSEIAAQLSLSPRSVETYRARMMDKLDVHDVAGLVRFAIRYGISPLD